MSGRQHSAVKHCANYFYVPLEDDYLLAYETLAAQLDPIKEEQGKPKSASSDCKAMIAATLEAWLNSKRATAKNENDLYVYLTIDQWVQQLRNRYSRTMIIQCHNEMAEEGSCIDPETGETLVGTIKKRPHIQNMFGYLLHLPVIQSLLDALPEKSPFEMRARPALGRPKKSSQKTDDISSEESSPKLNGINSDGINEKQSKNGLNYRKSSQKMDCSFYITQNHNYTEPNITQNQGDDAIAHHAALAFHPEHHFIAFDDLEKPTTMYLYLQPLPDWGNAESVLGYSEAEDKWRDAKAWEVEAYLSSKGIHVEVVVRRERLGQVVPASTPSNHIEEQQPTDVSYSPRTTGNDDEAQTKHERLTALLDSFRQGDPQEQRETLTALIEAGVVPASALDGNDASLITLSGSLTDGYVLRPIQVRVSLDDGEYIVSCPHTHIHGTGSTRDEAIAAFKRIILGEYMMLGRDEHELGSRLQQELAYLRSIITAGNDAQNGDPHARRDTHPASDCAHGVSGDVVRHQDRVQSPQGNMGRQLITLQEIDSENIHDDRQPAVEQPADGTVDNRPAAGLHPTLRDPEPSGTRPDTRPATTTLRTAQTSDAAAARAGHESATVGEGVADDTLTQPSVQAQAPGQELLTSQSNATQRTQTAREVVQTTPSLSVGNKAAGKGNKPARPSKKAKIELTEDQKHRARALKMMIEDRCGVLPTKGPNINENTCIAMLVQKYCDADIYDVSHFLFHCDFKWSKDENKYSIRGNIILEKMEPTLRLFAEKPALRTAEKPQPSQRPAPAPTSPRYPEAPKPPAGWSATAPMTATGASPSKFIVSSAARASVTEFLGV